MLRLVEVICNIRLYTEFPRLILIIFVSCPPSLAGTQLGHPHGYHYVCCGCLACRPDCRPMGCCSASAHALLELRGASKTRWCAGAHAGVRLASGKVLLAQFVVDTTGGRSHAVAKFLEEKCGQKVESIKFDVGLNYYTRFFRMPEKVIASHASTTKQ